MPHFLYYTIKGFLFVAFSQAPHRFDLNKFEINPSYSTSNPTYSPIEYNQNELPNRTLQTPRPGSRLGIHEQ